MCRQVLSWQFLYLFGILDALELEYNDRKLVGNLVYTHIGVLDKAENKPAGAAWVSHLHARTLLHGPVMGQPCWQHTACCVLRACELRACEQRVRYACVHYACVRHACASMRA